MREPRMSRMGFGSRGQGSVLGVGAGAVGGRDGHAANQQLEIQMCHRGSVEATPAESATWPAFVDRQAVHPVGW